jgi:hypothetical protein
LINFDQRGFSRREFRPDQRRVSDRHRQAVADLMHLRRISGTEIAITAVLHVGRCLLLSDGFKSAIARGPKSARTASRRSFASSATTGWAKWPISRHATPASGT